MIKKLLLVAGIVVIGGAVFKGSKVVGYVKNEIASAGDWLEDQVPIEKEIARLRGEVNKLDREISPIKDNLAKELYATEKLQKDAALLRASVEAEKKDMLARLTAIREAGDATHVSIGGSKQAIPLAKERLSADSKLLELKAYALTKKDESLQIAEKNVAVLQKQLAELQKQKTELKVEIDTIDADYKVIQLQQMENKYQRDDSRLGSVKDSIQKLKDRIAVKQKRVDLDKADAPAIKPAVVESLDDIEARLSK